jgi:hypothetical protein
VIRKHSTTENQQPELGIYEDPPVNRLRYILAVACTLMLFDARSVAAQGPPRLIHVFVALADNAHQGIVPVPAALGNGDDPARNLYWGAAFGVRTYFKKSAEWKEVATVQNPNSYVLERSVFVHGGSGTYLIAEAYRGREIKQAITDFYRSAAGLISEKMPPGARSTSPNADLPTTAALSVYVGHDGLMDFAIENRFQGAGNAHREAIILACASKLFFSNGLKSTGAQPLLWTTGLMAPEAYTLKAAVDGWIAGESAADTRQHAAAAYAKYQKCSMGAAQRLFSSGW